MPLQPSAVIRVSALALWALAANADATDWLSPGDARLRSDLMLLADAGEIDIPLSAWPLPVADVERALALREASDAENSGAITAWVQIDPDLHKLFPDSESVNKALRDYVEKGRGSST